MTMIRSLRRAPARRLALFLMLTGPAAAVLAAPGAAQDPEDPEEPLDAVAAAPVREGLAAGVAAAVVRGRDLLLLSSRGAADLELAAPLPVDAVFMVGSVTKTFTATAILQLVDAGRVGLDESLNTYLPDYPLQGRAVTLRHLLNHTSGIPGYTELTAYRGLQWRSLPRDSLLTLVAGRPFEFEPGSAMSYSNTGYFLLGLVIERVTGLSYGEYLERNVFESLGMERSGYCSSAELMEGRATGYSRDPDGALRRADPVDHTWPYAAGSVCSTVGDLARFSTALHGGEILSPASYRAMVEPDTLAGGHALRYGLGVFLQTDARGRPMIHHSGAIDGFLSETRYYPDADLHVVVLMNTLGVARPETVATALADRILGPSSAPEVRDGGDRGVPSQRAGEGWERRYVGTYVGRGFGRPMTVTVEGAGDGLIAVQGADTATLRHDLGATFLAPPDRFGTTAIYAFVGDDDPEAELHVDVAGGHFVLRRDDDRLAGLWDSPTPRTTMVELDGHAVRIRTAAPHPNRIPGRPLVVFEGGFGSTLNTWGSFLEQVAGLAPVVAYDRAGIGESDWDGVEPTFEHITGRLRRLLDQIGAEPPFVLVGHSFGGDLVRYFARFHPEETVGLVLLDPVTNSPADFVGALEEIGEGRERALEIYDAPLDDGVPPGVRAESRLVGAYFREDREFDLPRPTDVPVSILVTGVDPPPDGEDVYGFDVAAHVAAWERRKIARLGEWIMQVPLGEMIVVPSSSHFVHRDEPELAFEAVRRGMFPPIPRVLLQELDTRGPEAAVARYREMASWYPPDRFNEDVLNDFGYRLLRAERPEDAIPIFLLNRDEYPELLNPWDSLADGYRAAGRLEDEEETRARLVELAEERGDPRVGVYRERLERVRGELAGGG